MGGGGIKIKLKFDEEIHIIQYNMVMKVLYVAEMDSSQLVVFERNGDGSLTRKEEVPCAGTPMWTCTNKEVTKLYCATLKSTELVTFDINQATGSLTEIGKQVVVMVIDGHQNLPAKLHG